MLVQVVRFETELSEAEFMAAAEARVPAFREVPGLIQKYFVKFDEPGRYGGVYLWEDREAMADYRASELAASVGEAYRIAGEAVVETCEVLAALRKA